MKDYEQRAADTRAKVDALLAGASIFYSVEYVGEVDDPFKESQPKASDRYEVRTSPSKPQRMDAWRVTLRRAFAGGSSMTIPFYTGLGVRAPFPALYRRAPVNTIDWVNQEKSRKPLPPTATEVLSCIVRDGEAQHMSFHDWASDFGYDTDSLSALNTYNQCGETGRELTKVCGRELLTKLAEAMEDY